LRDIVMIRKVSDFYFVIQDQECALLHAIYTWMSDTNYCIKRLTVRVNRLPCKSFISQDGILPSFYRFAPTADLAEFFSPYYLYEKVSPGNLSVAKQDRCRKRGADRRHELSYC